MRHFSVPPKTVAFYSGKSERTVRRMCERGELDAERVGGEWLISVPGLKRRFRKMGPDFWHRVCYDIYPKREEAEAAFQEFIRIDAEAEAEEKMRGISQPRIRKKLEICPQRELR